MLDTINYKEALKLINASDFVGLINGTSEVYYYKNFDSYIKAKEGKIIIYTNRNEQLNDFPNNFLCEITLTPTSKLVTFKD